MVGRGGVYGKFYGDGREVDSVTDRESERILQQAGKKMTDEVMAVLCGSNAFKKPQPTSLRLTPSGAFEVVELRDDGSIIEPSKSCPKCGPLLLCAEHMAKIS